MVRSAPTSMRLDPDIKLALERAAQADDRSVSSLVERILKAWLIENRFLEAPAPGGHVLHDRLTAKEERALAAPPRPRRGPTSKPGGNR